MIAFLRGRIAVKASDHILVDVSGIGYEVAMPSLSFDGLPAVGEIVTVHTYLQVRDDGMSLFGFATVEEKDLFKRLIGVSGIGPKVALAALSAYRPDDLATAISAQDDAAIARIPGIGKKTAQRMILELKDSLIPSREDVPAPSSLRPSSAVEGASEALLSMGFTTTEADLALKGAPSDGSESDLLQYALKRLGGM